jgi:general secretion pathway protein B
MSLILDALKKSEAERQRQSGPTLLEVRVARPQRRYPMWALAVGILLAVNMILLLVFVLRPSDSVRAPSAATTAPASASVAVAAPSALPPAPATPVPASAAAAPAAATVQPVAQPPAQPALSYPAADAAVNPADDEPAVSAASASLRHQREAAGADYSTLPGINELTGSVPELRLDLHVYAERPRDRYALINMQTVHEGDVLNEGPRVLAITREGVALDWHNQQFMLRPQ